MGGRRRQVVDDKYTKPQGLYQHKDVDHKKLRKLILDSKLAPCYPGLDDATVNPNFDLEECPICFLVCIFLYVYVVFSFSLIDGSIVWWLCDFDGYVGLILLLLIACCGFLNFDFVQLFDLVSVLSES